MNRAPWSSTKGVPKSISTQADPHLGTTQHTKVHYWLHGNPEPNGNNGTLPYGPKMCNLLKIGKRGERGDQHSSQFGIHIGAAELGDGLCGTV